MGSNDKETSVLYKAIADFASLSREIRKAKADLAELKAEEAALNAASVKGSQQSSAARTSAVKQVEKEVDAFESAAAAATKHEKATTKAASATKNLVKESKDLAVDVERGAKAVEHQASALGKVGSEAEKAVTGARRTRQATSDMERGFQSAVGWAQKLSDGIKKITEPRSSGIINGPWVALVPLFASLLALVNPLVAGLNGAGVAALGFASNLGSLAGAALGAIPALASLLSVAGALRVAFAGIGGAFSAYAQTQKASSGGSGSGPQAEQLSQTDQITRANEKYKRSIQDVTWAQQDLTAAKQAYFKQVQDLQKAVDREATSEARASANVLLAKENYANVMADPGSTKGQRLDAKTSVSEAQQQQQDLFAQEKKDRADLAKLKKEGVNGDRQVIQAQRALTDAIWAQQDALMKLHDAQNGVGMSHGAAATAANAYAAALAKLSPSARSVVLQLIAMKDVWDKLHKTVQESFFSKIVGDIQRLRLLIGPVTALLSSAAGIAGDFAHTLLLRITGKSFIDDLGIITKNNTPILKHFFDGLLDIFNILTDLAVVAGPFTALLTGKMADGLKNLAGIVHAARDDGSLVTWLDKVNTRLSLWWHIFSNIVLTLWNYGAATSGLGDSLTKSFSKITDGWLAASKKARDPNSPFQQYLKDVRPVISELSKLFGDFFRWWAKTAEDPANTKAFTDIIRIIRTDLGPALGGLLKTLTQSGIGQDLAKAISAIARALDEVMKNGGINALKAFWQAIGFLAQALEKIASIPGVGALLGTLGTALMVLTVMRFTGLLQLITWLLRLSEKKGLISIFDSIGRAGKGAAATTAEDAAAYGAGTRRGPGGGAAGAAKSGRRADVAAAQDKASRRKGRRGPARPTTEAKNRLKNGLNFDPETGVVFPGHANERTAALTAERAAKYGGANLGERAAALAAERGASRGVAGVLGKLGMGALRGAAGGLSRGGIAGAVAGLAGGAVLDGVVRDGKGGARDLGADVGGAALTGAGIGATVGSIVPGVGTAIGAGAGAVVGAGISLASAKPEQYKKTGDDIGKWWKGVIKDWSDGWKQISGWFKGLVKNVSDWWDKHVVQPFSDAAKKVQDWWNYNVVRPAAAVMRAIGRLWDDYVVKPTKVIMKNVGDWWHDHVAVPAGKIMKGLGEWWHDHVAKPAHDIMAGIGTWWHDHVAKPAHDIFSGIGTWWHDHVAKPAHDIMAGIGNWWHDHVAQPAHDIFSGIGNWWHDNVAKPASDIFTGMGNWWHDNVEVPLGQLAYNLSHFSLSDLITNVANGIDPHRNSGGMIYRALGGGVPGRGNGDSVRARLTPGEFVLRKGIADRIGLDNLQMLNSGVLSFAQMLQNSAQGQQFAGNFGAGLVPSLPGVSIPTAARLQTGAAGAGHGGFHVENLNVHNPLPERTSDSLPKSIRKMTYLGIKR